MVGLGLLPQASHQNLLLYPSGLQQSSDPNDPQQLLNGLSHEQLQQLRAEKEATARSKQEAEAQARRDASSAYGFAGLWSLGSGMSFVLARVISMSPSMSKASRVSRAMGVLAAEAAVAAKTATALPRPPSPRMVSPMPIVSRLSWSTVAEPGRLAASRGVGRRRAAKRKPDKHVQHLKFNASPRRKAPPVKQSASVVIGSAPSSGGRRRGAPPAAASPSARASAASTAGCGSRAGFAPGNAKEGAGRGGVR